MCSVEYEFKSYVQDFCALSCYMRSRVSHTAIIRKKSRFILTVKKKNLGRVYDMVQLVIGCYITFYIKLNQIELYYINNFNDSVLYIGLCYV